MQSTFYSRSMYEIQAFFPKCGQRELMDAYLTIGGIPEYLKRIEKQELN